MISQRQLARQHGHNWYFTGKPCKHGHLSRRKVLTGSCYSCVTEARRRTMANFPGGAKEYSRELHYKIAKYPRPTRAEPAECELCGRKPKANSLCIDHDHTTGAFRGWLCVRCNSALGVFGDSIEGLERAISYLKRSLQ